MSRTITPRELKEMLAKDQKVTIVDVRRKADYAADRQMIPNAAWKDPEQIDRWSADLPQNLPVVVYCVRGGSVSNSVLDLLLKKNIDARYIEGGFTAWKDSGASTIDNAGSP